MARVDKSVAPYYDDFDPAKQYYQLLAIPGRVAQSRELTQLQSVLLDIVKSIGDASLSDGDVIEGCQVIIAEDKTSVRVTAGKVYMEGIVIPVAETDIPITGTGIENIGVKLMEVLVDERTDPSLLDPAQGYDNYGQAGCDRLKKWLQVTVNDPESAIITQLIDGEIAVETYKPENSQLEQILARRTYDESGSYLVNGLSTRVEPRDTNTYNVVIEAGKAYVLGYELKVPAARRLQSEKSKTTSVVTASNYVYEEGVSNYLLDNDPFVKDIIYVRGRVATTEQQSLTTDLDSVLLSNLDVVRLVSVTQGSTSYTIGTGPDNGDCYLLRDGTRYYVKWNGQDAPESGTSYNVNYEYNKDFINGTDYSLELINGSHYLVFKEDGEHPLDDSNFTVRYNQYLARKDIVYMDQYGAIYINKGIPAEYGFEVTPEVPVNTLAIAVINNPPNGTADLTDNTSSKIIVNNIGLTRFTMNDIQDLLNRVKRNEYDQAVLSLNEDARNVYTSNTKKGILTDPLVDLSRIDLYFNLDGDEPIDPDKPIYDMALDLSACHCYLPIKTAPYDLTIKNTSTTKTYNRLISLAVTDEDNFLEQPTATTSFQINPYSMSKQSPEISVDPAIDTWVDDTIINLPVSLTDSQIVSTSSRRIDKRWDTKKVSTTQIGTSVSTSVSSALLSEEAITYIRQREINIVGKNFAPDVDNIKCTFDGQTVALTPTGTTQAGTSSGTVKADANGSITAKFTIPEGVRTGVREVMLGTSIDVAGYLPSGFTTYQGTGTKRVFQQTITTLTTILLNQDTSYIRVDPIAQTFVPDRVVLLKGIDLYFEAKPTLNQSVVVEIRNVESNGYIGKTVYGSKTLSPNDVNVSNTASTATRFNFSDPILLDADTEYAFVVRSVSDKYRLWISELGKVDVSTGKQVAKNPYMTGVMMSSSNNSTWTSHQTSDIKFSLVEDVYASNSTVFFNSVDVEDATRLLLTAETAMPTGTSINWLYSLDGGTTYIPIPEGTLRELDSAYETVDIKGELTNTSGENISPLIAKDTLTLVGSSYYTEGTYITKNVTGLSAYTTVKIIVDTYIPAGCSLTPKISGDNGDTLVTAVLDQSSIVQLDGGWRELTYNATLSNSSTSTQCRVFIEASSNSTSVTPKFSRLRCIMS